MSRYFSSPFRVHVCRKTFLKNGPKSFSRPPDATQRACVHIIIHALPSLQQATAAGKKNNSRKIVKLSCRQTCCCVADDSLLSFWYFFHPCNDGQKRNEDKERYEMAKFTHLYEQRNGDKYGKDKHSAESVKVQGSSASSVHQRNWYKGHAYHYYSNTNRSELWGLLTEPGFIKQLGRIVKYLEKFRTRLTASSW